MKDFNSLMKLARKLSRNGYPLDDKPRVRLAVLGSTSLQHFVMILRAVLYERGIYADIYEGEYNGINMDVYNEDSAFYQFKPEYVLILTHYLDVKEYPQWVDYEDAEAICNNVVDYYKNLWDLISRCLPDAKILQSNFAVPPEHLLGNMERLVAYSRSSFLERINKELVNASGMQVSVVDLDLLSGYEGKENWFDYAAYFLNKAGCRLDYLPDVAAAYAKLIELKLGKVRKCLVLDLDNTIWGGTVGDLGYDGIMLDPNDAAGEAYRYFQKYVLALKERGVILAVCSKNEDAIAREPFEKNKYMLLGLDDIACFVANWQDKASNLRYIANELNIGVDSLVFFDDNPAEREIVRRYLPEVEVIEVPEDPALYVSALDRDAPFQWLELTREDVLRNNSYIKNRQRQELSRQFVDYASYLKELDMYGRVFEIDKLNVSRFTQLLNKSNQFNLRTERYDENEISGMMQDRDYRLLAFELRDKFSEYGIISCVILQKQGDNCFIRSWVMSCRVLKRGVEYMMFEEICKAARSMGCSDILGEYLPTKKNILVRDFLDDLGFILDKESEDGSRYYHFAAGQEPEKVHYIKHME